ncbi:MAG: hypothetical protein Q7U56_08825 [Humidesulfovibrio sp.]|nr:hypothetical protein [Humidesulfovibrio sp.]
MAKVVVVSGGAAGAGAVVDDTGDLAGDGDQKVFDIGAESEDIL